MIKVIARLRERIRERNETEIGRMEMGERERERGKPHVCKLLITRTSSFYKVQGVRYQFTSG